MACRGPVAAALVWLATGAAADFDPDAYPRHETCALCHGLFGTSHTGKFPNLGGQKPAYLKAQINAFLDGTRTNDGGQMAAIVLELQPGDLENVVAWFAQQDPPAPYDHGDTSRGRALYARLDCGSCHDASQNRPSAPHLTAQHAAYLIKQMEDFRSGARPLRATSHRSLAGDMTETDITPSAILLSEYFLELNEGAGFLNTLSDADSKAVRGHATRCSFGKGDAIFNQGAPHTGVWIIEKGRVRSYYVGPSGREITLAYWSVGHFVGGPEVFARGRHVWSADALEASELLFLSGTSLLKLVREIPDVAVAVIDGLVAKGKSYSALIQMLGTRTVSERLSQLLVILADTIGRPEGDSIVIDRTVTYEQIAAIVGATRQWVTQSLDKHKSAGVLDITRAQIIIHKLESLEQ